MRKTWQILCRNPDISCLFFIYSLPELLFAYMNNLWSRRRATGVGQQRLSEAKVQPSLY